MNIEIHEMRQVQAIASEGSFAKAARVLYISQPALSRSIQEVERKAGFKLFERGRQGAHLTDSGRAFLVQASDILALADNMDRELARIKGLDTGKLNIGAGVFAVDMFTGEALARLMKAGSDLSFRIIADQADKLLQRLRRRELDLLVVDTAWIDHPHDINQIKLSAHQGYLVVRKGHPLLSRPHLRLQDVVNYPLTTMALVPDRMALWAKTLRGEAAAQLQIIGKWTPTVTVNSITSIKTMVRQSDAVMYSSLNVIHHELEQKTLALLPIHLPWLKPEFAIMHLAHRTLSPLAEAVTRALMEADQRLVLREERLARRWFPSSMA